MKRKLIDLDTDIEQQLKDPKFARAYARELRIELAQMYAIIAYVLNARNASGTWIRRRVKEMLREAGG